MQRLEDSGAVGPIYGSLGVKRLNIIINPTQEIHCFCSLIKEYSYPTQQGNTSINPHTTDTWFVEPLYWDTRYHMV